MHLLRRTVILVFIVLIGLVALIPSPVAAASSQATTSHGIASRRQPVKPHIPAYINLCVNQDGTLATPGDIVYRKQPDGSLVWMQCKCFKQVLRGGTIVECRWVVIYNQTPNPATWLNYNSYLYMDVEGPSTNNGARVHQWTYTGGSNQWWYMSQSSYYNDIPSYTAVSQYSGKCLGVGGGSTNQGAPIVQWGCNGNPDQAWIWAYTNFDSGGWPVFNIIDYNSGMCMGITSGSTAVGAYAVQWACDGSDNQMWF